MYKSEVVNYRYSRLTIHVLYSHLTILSRVFYQKIKKFSRGTKMFPERLKALRLEANLTQSDVAKSLNISQPSYAQWENGRRKPSSETLEKFSKFYNVSTDYLLGNSDYKNSDEIDLSTFEILYRKTSKNLSDEDKKILEEDLKEFLLEREKAIKAIQSKE